MAVLVATMADAQAPAAGIVLGGPQGHGFVGSVFTRDRNPPLRFAAETLSNDACAMRRGQSCVRYAVTASSGELLLRAETDLRLPDSGRYFVRYDFGGGALRIAVYAIDPDRGIERVFARNGSATGLLHLGVFRSGDANYLLAEQRNNEHWKSAFELAGSRDKGFELVAVKADRVRVFADGLRSTMAHSAERGAYVRFLDHRTIEFIPE